MVVPSSFSLLEPVFELGRDPPLFRVVVVLLMVLPVVVAMLSSFSLSEPFCEVGRGPPLPPLVAVLSSFSLSEPVFELGRVRTLVPVVVVLISPSSPLKRLPLTEPVQVEHGIL